MESYHFSRIQKISVFFILILILIITAGTFIALWRIENRQAMSLVSEAARRSVQMPRPSQTPTPSAIPPLPSGTVAYSVPVGTVGNQCHGGPLGMDFDVHQNIAITHLGVFDDKQDGLMRSISVGVFNRTTQKLLGYVTINPGEGLLIDGSRFVELDNPIVVDTIAGVFPGTIVAQGYSQQIGLMCPQPEENNGNSLGNPPSWSVNGGGAIEFVGSSRYGWGSYVTSSANSLPAGASLPALTFPTIIDGGPVNRYAAGTFIFKPI